MEVAAVVLPVLVLGAVCGLVLLAILLRRAEFLAGAASFVVFCAVAVYLPWIPHSTGHPADGVTIVVANTLTENTVATQAGKDLVAMDADIVVVPEDSFEVHDQLAAAYPFFIWNLNALGVYSKVPVTELPRPEGVFDGKRFARVQVDTDTPFVLWAMHLPRLSLQSKEISQRRPAEHARVVDRFREAIDAETLPVVAAGDMNLTDRGLGYRKMTAHLDDAARSVWGGRSEVKGFYRPLLLNIDHILMPPSWCADQARRFDITGSDHRGVTARVGPCR